MYAYMRNKKTGSISKVSAAVACDYEATGEWIQSNVIEYEKQQHGAVDVTPDKQQHKNKK